MKLDKKLVELIFTKWVKSRKMMDEDTTPRDFDCWMGGFVAGHSYHNYKTDADDYDTVIKYMVTSGVAKQIGITGTKKEVYETYEIN